MKKILLLGNPNVGKSVIFSRLTGVKVIVSNYPGTTVEFTKGIMHLDHKDTEVIDVPGTYTLQHPTNKAEEVAIEMLNSNFSQPTEENVVINVIDATSLEKGLNLTLQLIKRKIPFIIALNCWDETKNKGINIDVEKLEKILNVFCVPTCAISGEGIKELVEKIKKISPSNFDFPEEKRWETIKKIVESVQTLTPRQIPFLEKLNRISIHPLTGVPLALGIIFLAFYAIRFIGEGIIIGIAEPLFEKLWAPLMLKLSNFLGSSGFIHNILIGNLIDGEIDFTLSFGVLTTGLFVPFAQVLPYVFAFYLVISLFEDFGYLPRLAVLADNLMHKIGLHGYAIIPFMLSFGCNVPGALSSRIMETDRERFISATLISITIPCMAQIAMIFGLLGKYGAKGLSPVFITLFCVWLIAGLILNKILKGHSAELFIEIPPYRLPHFKTLFKKVRMRIVWFLKEAVPWVLLGVFIVNILYTTGIIKFLGKIFQPVISKIMGLPPEAVGALIVGFLRKDVAVGMLAPLNLNLKQLIIASVVLAMYFPCVATFAVLIKELGLKNMLKATLIMVCSTLIVSWLLNLIL